LSGWQRGRGAKIDEMGGDQLFVDVMVDFFNGDMVIFRRCMVKDFSKLVKNNFSMGVDF